MPCTPGCPDPDRLPEISFFVDYVGYRHNMVGICGVFEPEEEPECKDGHNAWGDVKHFYSADVNDRCLVRREWRGFDDDGLGVARPEGFEPPTLWFEARCSVP